MVLNTTNGPREVPRGHVVNTSRIVEEDLVYEGEESEILAVLSGGGWYARVGDDVIPLVAFVAMDTGKLYGVEVGEDGFIDLTDNVEDRPGFVGYEQANNNDSKE